MVATPTYTCSVCGLGVILLEGQLIRGCEHKDAPVNAAVRAKIQGKSSFAQVKK